ncbi:hypothetical protein GOV12_03950 [Candidatus Pacearchaeota archaeon]|nr:hypothetical protein [Candidatus Pacearchaeota archaeon]
MKKRLNKAVSMYIKPVLGTISGKKPIMALTVDKLTLKNKTKFGIARIIKKRKGNPDIAGFLDKSKLIIVNSKDFLKWKKVKNLKIKNIKKIIKDLSKEDMTFIGLEDPDIYNQKGIKHLYFTIAFKLKNKKGYKIYLGHAIGKSLNKLIATDPLLNPQGKYVRGFKEISIPKIKYSKFILTEAQLCNNKNCFSVIEEVTDNYKHHHIVLDPRKMKYNWCKGELSPCCFLPKKFLSYKNLLIGIINGREKSKKLNKKTYYGKFKPGLILFNPKTGEIPWISPEPLFEDPDAKTITFASDFVKTSKTKGILYCHVNDSFVRAYEINKNKLKNLLPKKI